MRSFTAALIPKPDIMYVKTGARIQSLERVIEKKTCLVEDDASLKESSRPFTKPLVIIRTAPV